jgi:hypothetical protein
MARYPAEEFEIDLTRRSARHMPSGIEFWFEKFKIVDDWFDAGPKAHSANSDWEGDIGLLGRCAKAAAVASGMKAA